MADLNAMRERWGAAINGYVSVNDIPTIEQARKLLDQAIEDIETLAKDLVQEEKKNVDAKALFDARHAFHLYTLGLAPSDESVEAVDFEIQRLAAFGKIGRAAAVAEAGEDNDQAFDDASDRLWAGARDLAGLPARDGVVAQVGRVADTGPAPAGGASCDS